MSERKYFCICEANCKFETMTKEQILAAITQAVESGTVSDVDTGFVTKIKELNSGKAVTMWVGTTAQYNALTEHVENCIYIKVDDTTGEDLQNAVERALEAMEETEAGLQVAKSFLSVAGADNGVLTDALAINWTDPFADVNKPRLANMDTANIPDNFGGGTRYVVFSKTTIPQLAFVIIVGQTTTGDGNMWVNKTSGSTWSGWVSLGESDYIEESGKTENGSTYSIQKYKSGYARATFIVKATGYNIDQEFGDSLYWQGQMTTMGIAFPVALENEPFTCNLSIRNIDCADPTTAGVFLLVGGKPTAERTQCFSVVSNKSIYGADIVFNIDVTWNWKE